MSQSPSDRKPRRFPLQLDQLAASRSHGPRPSSSSGVRVPPNAPELLRPQAHLQAVERERRRQHAPQGLGLDSVHVRRRMVERLMADGISHAGVLEAFAAVPRHMFVDTALVNQAYEDTSLPIGLGQTISKPSVVAAMMQLLCVRPGLNGAEMGVMPARPPLGRCLEIGTGCGYQAALLAYLSSRVVSIERLHDLHAKARTNLEQMRTALPQWPEIRLIYGDGMVGHAPHAPYDTIIAAAGGSALPQAWVDQLAPGGRLVAPTQEGAGQVLTVLDRLPDGSLQYSRAGAVLFVPLKSGTT